MTSTAASRILDHLKRRGEASDQEMARDLDLPEASVRRTRNALVNEGRIYSPSYVAIPQVWRLRTEIFPLAAVPDVAECAEQA